MNIKHSKTISEQNSLSLEFFSPDANDEEILISHIMNMAAVLAAVVFHTFYFVNLLSPYALINQTSVLFVEVVQHKKNGDDLSEGRSLIT